MECRTTHDDPSYIYRFEIGYWCHCSCSSYRMFYGEDLSTDLLRWEFIGDSIAWVVLSTSEVIPEGHIIELQDHSIDVEIEIFFSIFCFFIKNHTEIIDS